MKYKQKPFLSLERELVQVSELYDEAIKLGQTERATKLGERVYELAYEVYRVTCFKIQNLDETIREQKDKQLIKLLTDVRENLALSAEQQVKELGRYL